MAINFPTGLDDFTDYVDGSTVIIAATLNNMQLGIEANQVKIGIDGSGVTSSHTYKLDQITGAWAAWTPTITQGVGVTFTQTYAKYRQISKLNIVACNLAVTSAGTGGQVITVGNLPVNIDGSPRSLGSGAVTNTGTASYAGDVQATTGTTVIFSGFNQGSAVGATPSFALASGDIVSFMIMYETA